VLVTAIAVAIGVLRTSSEPPAPVDPLAVRLASVDTTTMTVRRAAFCDGLADAAAATLGASVASQASWEPGDRTQLAPHVKDVADEYGCAWTSAAGAVARAWVFAPPVTRDRAADLAATKPTGGCRPAAGMPAFGAPTSALTCGDTTVVRGLFGDAWLSCSLASHDLDLVGRWCLAVAQAAA
jgi:hypothetical protein